MSDHASSQTDPPRGDGFSEVINLLAAPLASGLRSYEQFRRGIDELFRTVENLNTTMENLNETATRVNALLADVEQPIRAMVPRMTRTVEAADEFMDAVVGPATRAAPNLVRLVDTLSAPSFTALPERVDEFLGVMSEVSRRLGPVAQLAESAGGMFGLRLPGTSRPAADPPRPTSPAAATPARSPVNTDLGNTAPAEQPPAEKAPAKKAPAKKSPARKTPARKAPGKKAAGKRSTAKKTAARR